MNFQRIFIEKDIAENARTKAIVSRLGDRPITYIDKVEDVFGRVHKPYLQKRDNLNLFIGEKKGQLVKPAPDAYGLGGAPHYYFIHAYNCIYECQYCYLQGYFQSPDIVLFINHEEICTEIARLCQTEHADQKEVWFHAGEFSDSLALSGLTREWSVYWDTFAKLPNGRLELRTKSSNVRLIQDLEPLSNVIISFSLSPDEASRAYDTKTPPLMARLKAMKSLAEKGHRIGLHLDPIIFTEDYAEQYAGLLSQILDHIREDQINYISLGVVRFTKKVYQCMKKNYPDSAIHTGEFAKSFDEKVRYPRPLRLTVLQTIRQLATERAIHPAKIYLCMEDVD